MGGRRRLPDALPIVAAGRRCGDAPAAARELTAPLDLCDARGRLAPDAVGWARRPLVRANLRGHWPRKKRWNFWNWIGPRFVLSATLADVDYAAFCQVQVIDFATRRTVGATALAPPGSVPLPEHVERSVAFHRGRVRYTNTYADGGADVAIDAVAPRGERIVAAFRVGTPPAHESLTIVVPWSRDRFQLNCKQNGLPCAGEVAVGDVRYAMDPAECHAVLDWGRGVWPYRSFWNWGVATGVQDGVRIGVNVGGKWTTGTGVNENGLFVDGRLHKIPDDVRWDYDPDDWMRPWRVVAERSRMVDLVLEPVVAHRTGLSLGVLATGGVCCFGRWRGTLRLDGQDVPVRDLMGWAEEFAHRW